MSGSYLSHMTYGSYYPDWEASGSYYPGSDHITNHVLTTRDLIESAEQMWERMYIQPKPVIVVCGYCKCHNAISNPACIQCGAPMGSSSVVRY